MHWSWILHWNLARSPPHGPALGGKEAHATGGELCASWWSWAALEGPVAFPISIAHHEYGRELPEMTSEVALLLAVQEAPTTSEEAI